MPLTLEFPAPCHPISTNEARGQHWAKVWGATIDWHNAAWAVTRNAIVTRKVPWPYQWGTEGLAPGALDGPTPVTIQVAIPFRQHRTRDPHNYVGTVVKAIVDGIVKAGLVPDDNPDWVTVLEPTLVIIPAPAPLTVTITIQERTPR